WWWRCWAACSRSAARWSGPSASRSSSGPSAVSGRSTGRSSSGPWSSSSSWRCRRASSVSSGGECGRGREAAARPVKATAPGTDGPFVLQVNGLKKHFGGVQAVNGVDLAVPAGDRRAIIGPNGAGQTTLFNLLSRDLSHDSGEVYFMGQDVTGLAPHLLCRRGMGRTFQITSIFRRLTAVDNVLTALLTHHRHQYNFLAPARRFYRDEAHALLDRVGLL